MFQFYDKSIVRRDAGVISKLGSLFSTTTTSSAVAVAPCFPPSICLGSGRESTLLHLNFTVSHGLKSGPGAVLSSLPKSSRQVCWRHQKKQKGLQCHGMSSTLKIKHLLLVKELRQPCLFPPSQHQNFLLRRKEQRERYDLMYPCDYKLRTECIDPKQPPF